MKRWSKLGLGAAAAVLALAAAGGAWAMWGDDSGTDGKSRQTIEDAGGAAGICLEGATDCVDTMDADGSKRPVPTRIATSDEGDPASGGAAGGTCPAGAADCADIPGAEQPDGGPARMCARDVPVCNDMLGGTGDCAPDQVCAPDVPCPAGEEGSYCVLPECPAIAPAIDPAATAEAGSEPPDCAVVDPPEPCDDTLGSPGRCLPPDCAVSSDGTVVCPDEAPPVDSGEGSSEPGAPVEPAR